MFVVNCVVVHGEKLTFKQNQKQTPRKSPKKASMDFEVCMCEAILVITFSCLSARRR